MGKRVFFSFRNFEKRNLNDDMEVFDFVVILVSLLSTPPHVCAVTHKTGGAQAQTAERTSAGIMGNPLRLSGDLGRGTWAISTFGRIGFMEDRRGWDPIKLVCLSVTP